MSRHRISDELPVRIRVLVVAATGLLRQEIARAADDDFEVVTVADARAAEEAARTAPHALVVVADDLYNVTLDELVSRVRVRAPGDFRVAVMVLTAHGESPDLVATYHAGADDVGRWPQEADMFRARIRSLVRAAMLEASMSSAADTGAAGLGDLRAALSHAIHLINNSVAGISGRAQIAALTGAADDAALVPVCLSEARKLSRVLCALHHLSESVDAANGDLDETDALVLAGDPLRR